MADQFRLKRTQLGSAELGIRNLAEATRARRKNASNFVYENSVVSALSVKQRLSSNHGSTADAPIGTLRGLIDLPESKSKAVFADALVRRAALPRLELRSACKS